MGIRKGAPSTNDDFLSKIPSDTQSAQRSITSKHLPQTGWYYAVSGTRFGPVSIDKLRNFLRDGAIPPETHVYSSVMDSWRPAYKVTPLWRPPASELPSHKWYINQSGEVSEGYTTAQIWDMIEQGRIKADTQLYSKSIHRWKRAENIMIFSSAWQTPSAPPTPPSQTPDLPEHSQQQNVTAAQQYDRCEKLLGRAESCIEEWNCEAAREAIEEASDLEISQQDEDFRAHIQHLTARIDRREKERAQNRQDAEDLLHEAQTQLEENDTLAVFETILKLREMPILQHDDGLASRVDKLQEQAEETERELVAAREDAAEAVEMARECLNNWEISQAQQYCEEAAESPACEFSDELVHEIGVLQEDLSEARRELKEARSRAGTKLDQAEEHIEDYRLDDAREILNNLRDNTAVQAGGDVADRHGELRSELHSIDQELETERQQVPALIEQAREETANWNIETARSLLTEASNARILDIDSDLKDQVDRAFDHVEETEEQIQGERNKARKQLANAERQCAIYNFDSAFDIIENIEELEAARKDSAISERLHDLKQRLKKKKNHVQKQRSRVRKTLDSLQQALDNWDTKRARSLFDKLGKANLNRIDPDIRRDIREAQTRLKELGQKAQQQTRKAKTLLKKINNKIEQKRFGVARDNLERLENLEIIGHRTKWLKKVKAKRKEVKSEKSKWDKLQKKTDKLLNTAHSHLKNSNFNEANKLLDKVDELETAQHAKAVQSRLNHLRDRIRQKREAQARAIVKKADNLAQKNPDEAERKLNQADHIEISSDNNLKPMIRRVRTKIQTERGQRQELQTLLDEVDEYIEKDKLRSARKTYNKIIDTGGWDQDSKLRERLKKQKQKIITRINSIKKKRKQSDSGQRTSTQAAQKSGDARNITGENLHKQDWYYCTGEDKKGPVSLNKLQKLARTQKIEPEDYVWAQCLEAWVQAHMVNDLADCFE